MSVEDESALVTAPNENGPSPFLIVANRAGNSMPHARSARPSGNRMQRPHRREHQYSRVFLHRGGWLDAALLEQNYLRLVIDCNRAPTSERPDMIFGTDRCRVFGTKPVARNCIASSDWKLVAQPPPSPVTSWPKHSEPFRGPIFSDDLSCRQSIPSHRVWPSLEPIFGPRVILGPCVDLSPWK